MIWFLYFITFDKHMKQNRSGAPESSWLLSPRSLIGRSLRTRLKSQREFKKHERRCLRPHPDVLLLTVAMVTPGVHSFPACKSETCVKIENFVFVSFVNDDASRRVVWVNKQEVCREAGCVFTSTATKRNKPTEWTSVASHHVTSGPERSRDQWTGAVTWPVDRSGHVTSGPERSCDASGALAWTEIVSDTERNSFTSLSLTRALTAAPCWDSSAAESRSCCDQTTPSDMLRWF